MTFLAGGVAICALGLYDDIRGSGAGVKFLIQFGIAGALYYAGFRIEVLSLPFVGTVTLGGGKVVSTDSDGKFSVVGLEALAAGDPRRAARPALEISL